MILRLFILFFIISCSVDKKNSVDSKELVGIWQVIPEVASGWADNYQFFDNGEFTFNYSQMICDKRVLDYSGTWEFADADNLRLTITSRTVLEGGKLVPAMGSCGSEYEIEGGEVKTIKLNEAEVQNFQLSAITQDRSLSMRTFNEKTFWKMEDDPTKY